MWCPFEHLAGVEDEISKAADELIDAIQRGKLNVLSEIKSIKVKRVKQL